MIRSLGLFLFGMVMVVEVYCQENHKLFLTTNANLYVPFNSHKGIFPILGYDKKDNPKLLIGGFGVGGSVFRSIIDKIEFKGQLNFSRHTYWNEPTHLKSEYNMDVGVYFSRSNDYNLGLNATAHYFFGRKFSVGTGLGTQIMLVSLTRNPFGNFGTDNRAIINRHNKTIMPVVPIEVSLRFEKTFYCIRYEQSLLNKFKNDLADRMKENYGLLSFEFGIKINRGQL